MANDSRPAPPAPVVTVAPLIMIATLLDSTRRAVFAASLAALAGAGGCYNGDALVERVRNDALRERREEVDLGQYRITMPRNYETAETVEVDLHLFGSLARYKQAEVEEQLEEQRYLLRHDTLMAIRQSTREDFTDPDLTALRQRLLVATNELLDEPSFETIGFHRIRFTRH